MSRMRFSKAAVVCFIGFLVFSMWVSAAEWDFKVEQVEAECGQEGIPVGVYLAGDTDFVAKLDCSIQWYCPELELAGNPDFNRPGQVSEQLPEDENLWMEVDPCGIRFDFSKPGLDKALEGLAADLADASPVAIFYLNHTGPEGNKEIPFTTTASASVAGRGTTNVVQEGGVQVGPCGPTGTYQLSFSQASACPGGSATVDVLMTSTDNVQAFSVGMGFDPAAATLTDVSLGAAASGADYFEPYIESEEGWSTVGVVVETGEDTPSFIEAGEDLAIVTFTFDILCAANGTVPLAFEDGHVVGDPPELEVNNELTVNDTAVHAPELELVDGEITVEPQGSLTVTAEQAEDCGPAEICWSLEGCGAPVEFVSIARGSEILSEEAIGNCYTDDLCEAGLGSGIYEYNVVVSTACFGEIIGSASVEAVVEGSLNVTAEQTEEFGPVNVCWNWEGCGGPVELVSIERGGEVIAEEAAENCYADDLCAAGAEDGDYEYTVTVSSPCFGEVSNSATAEGVVCEEVVYGLRYGDCNNDGEIQLPDAIKILDLLFTPDEEVPGCLLACDANGSAQISITDAVYLLSYLFRDGSAPPEGGSCVAVPAEPPHSCTGYCEVP